MLTLAEAAKIEKDELRAGVLETFVQESPVLDRIPLLDIEGNSYKYNKEAALPGVEFRAVNAAYTESTGTFVQASEGLAILGGEADVDTYIQQTRSSLNDQRAIQERMKVKAISYKYQETFINGDVAVDVNSFDGLKKRLTGAQVIDAGVNGINILGTTTTERQVFFDKLDELLAIVPGADVLYADEVIIRKFSSAARRETIETTQIETLGKRAFSYGGVPFLPIGTNAAGTKIIPITETQGTAVNSSSIYAVRYGRDEGDAAVTGLSNGGVMVEDLGKLQSKPAWRTRIEFFPGLAVFGAKGAARLRGVLNA